MGTNFIVPSDNGTRPFLNELGTLSMPPPSLWEYALQPLYPYFFDEEEMPTFLQNLNLFDDSLPDGDITTGTMHVFLSDPFAMTCDSDVDLEDESTDGKDNVTAIIVGTTLGAVALAAVVGGIAYHVASSRAQMQSQNSASYVKM